MAIDSLTQKQVYGPNPRPPRRGARRGFPLNESGINVNRTQAERDRSGSNETANRHGSDNRTDVNEGIDEHI